MFSRGEPEGKHEISGLVCLKSEGEVVSQDFTVQKQGLIGILIFEGCKVWDRPSGDLSL